MRNFKVVVEEQGEEKGKLTQVECWVRANDENDVKTVLMSIYPAIKNVPSIKEMP